MIVGACGFGSTGSSAVTDYLKEYDSFQVLDRIEFTWVSVDDGLTDLDIIFATLITGRRILSIYHRKV